MNIIHSKRQNAFTLVELLIVIVIIGILAAISIVAYNGIADKANDSVVQQEVAQMYKHIKTQEALEGKRFWDDDYDYYDESTYDESSGGSTLNADARTHLESWLGSKPSRSSLYDKADDASIVIIESKARSSDGEHYVPVIYARSKSGKVFVYDGSLTRAIKDGYEDQKAYIEEEIAWREEDIRLLDACVANPSACVDPDGNPFEWTAEDTIRWNGSDGKQYYLDELVDWRADLEELKANQDLNVLNLLESRTNQYRLTYFSTDDTWRYRIMSY